MGRVVITRNANDALTAEDVDSALNRHASNDWGDLCNEDRRLNDRATSRNSGRIFSAYHDVNGTKFWIITEADRCYTTVLLPSDY